MGGPSKNIRLLTPAFFNDTFRQGVFFQSNSTAVKDAASHDGNAVEIGGYEYVTGNETDEAVIGDHLYGDVLTSGSDEYIVIGTDGPAEKGKEPWIFIPALFREAAGLLHIGAGGGKHPAPDPQVEASSKKSNPKNYTEDDLSGLQERVEAGDFKARVLLLDLISEHNNPHAKEIIGRIDIDKVVGHMGWPMERIYFAAAAASYHNPKAIRYLKSQAAKGVEAAGMALDSLGIGWSEPDSTLQN